MHKKSIEFNIKACEYTIDRISNCRSIHSVLIELPRLDAAVVAQVLKEHISQLKEILNDNKSQGM